MNYDESVEMSQQISLYIAVRDKCVRSFDLDEFADEFESRLIDYLIWLRTGRI